MLLAVVAASGQAPEGHRLRVTTRLVQVSVVVHGRSAAAARLTKDDFLVFDNGKARPVALFEAGAGKPGAVNQPAAPPPLPPHVYSNRVGRRAGGVSIVLLDALNTPEAQDASAKAQAIRCLGQLEASNRIALYVLDRALYVLHDFTEDTAHLREALARYRAARSPGIDLDPARGGLSPNPALAGTPLDRMAAEANASVSESYAIKRTEVTLSALEAIARYVKRIPGHKSLIWVSSAFPLMVYSPGRGRLSFDEEAHRVTRAMNDADIAIYPVYAGGLANVSALTAEGGRSTARAPRAGTYSAPVLPASMRTLADETGGTTYFHTNDLGGAVRQALADSAASYTLGFYPAEDSLDGKFHELRVQMKAKGFTVRHRRGYFATADSAPTGQQRAAELRRALSSPLDSSAVGMSVRVDPDDKPKPGSLRFVVGIDVNTLGLESRGDHKVGAAEMILVQQAADGRQLHAASDTIRLDLNPEQFESLARDGLVLVKNLEAAPEVYQIRVLVWSVGSDAIGSVRVPGIQALLKP